MAGYNRYKQNIWCRIY